MYINQIRYTISKLPLRMKSSRLATILINCHTIIFTFWVAAALALAYFAINYSSKTSMYFAPPANSLSKASIEVVNETFPALTHQETVAVTVNDRSGNYYVNGSVLCANLQIQSKLQEFVEDVYSVINQDYKQYYLNGMDYFTASKQFLLANQMFCKDSSMMIQLVFNASWNGMKEMHTMKKDFNSIFDKTLGGTGLQLATISTSSLNDDIARGTDMDILKLDSFSIILGFIIVSLFIKQLKLLIISIVNLAICFSISLGVSYFIASYMDVASFASAIQSAACVALTFDYSLFLFSKVKEQIQLGQNPHTIVEEMIKHSGHVVFISGLCLSCVFLLLLVCPVKIVWSIGICCCATIFIIDIESITNSVAILCLFPKFFIGEQFSFWSYDYINPKRTIYTEAIKSDRMEVTIEMPSNADTRKCHSYCIKYCTVQKFEKSQNLKCGKWLYKFLQGIVSKRWIAAIASLVVVGISLAFLYPVLHLKYSIDVTQLIPRNSETLKSIKYFGQQYGDGLIEPFYVIFNNTNQNISNSLVTQQNFDLMGQMAEQFIVQSQVQFQGNLSFLQLNSSQLMALFYYGSALTTQQFQYLSTISDFQLLLSQTAPNSQNLQTFALMITSNVPMTAKGAKEFSTMYRQVIANYSPQFAQLGVQVTEYAQQCSMIDAVDQLFSNFYIIILVTCAVIFVILAFSFQSLFASIRLLVEMVLIDIFYFGINILVFQYAHLHDDDALSWGAILMMFSISLGLACDYDIFSFNGIYMHFKENFGRSVQQGSKFDFKESVLASFNNVEIVMTAGLIMIISFLGLTFSEIDLLLQVGMCLVFGLMFNTFIVVPILVPCIGYIFDVMNMFPGCVFTNHKLLKSETQAFIKPATE